MLRPMRSIRHVSCNKISFFYPVFFLKNLFLFYRTLISRPTPPRLNPTHPTPPPCKPPSPHITPAYPSSILSSSSYTIQHLSSPPPKPPLPLPLPSHPSTPRLHNELKAQSRAMRTCRWLKKPTLHPPQYTHMQHAHTPTCAHMAHPHHAEIPRIDGSPKLL